MKITEIKAIQDLAECVGITRAKKGIILCEVSPAVANEPSCKSFMFYSNYGLENYKKWLNAFLPSNTLTFDHLQPCSSKS